MSSTSFGPRILFCPSKNISRCMWGRPRFWNSIVWTNPATLPNIPPLISFKRASFFSAKTRATMSGRSVTSCVFPSTVSSFNRASVISGHFGFAVIVRNMSGLRQKRQIAMESWNSWYMCRALPIWVEGSITRCPLSARFSFTWLSTPAASCRPS